MGCGDSKLAPSDGNATFDHRIAIKSSKPSGNFSAAFVNITRTKISEPTSAAMLHALRGFCALNEAPEEVFVNLIKHASCELIDAGSEVIQEGAPSDKLYFVESGAIKAKGTETVEQVIEPGALFNELAVLFEFPSQVTAFASGQDCILWSLSRTQFKAEQRLQQKLKQAQQIKKFMHVPELCNPSLQDVLARLSLAISRHHYDPGDRLFTANMAARDMVLIEKGRLLVTFSPRKIMDFSPEGVLKALHIVPPFGEEVEANIQLKSLSNHADERSFVLTEGYVVGAGIFRGRAGVVDAWTWETTPNLSNERYQVVEADIEGGVSPLSATVIDGPLECSSFSVDAFERLCGVCGDSFVLHADQEGDDGLPVPLSPAGRDQFLEKSVERRDLLAAGALAQKFHLHNFDKSVVIGKLEHGLVIRAEFTADVDPNAAVPDPAIEERRKFKEKKKAAAGKKMPVKKAPEKQVYILKFLSKQRLEQTEYVNNAVEERRLLTALDHQYVCKLFGTIQTPDELVYVLENLEGGDLWRVIYNADTHRRMHAAVEKNAADSKAGGPKRSQSFLQRAATFISPATSPVASPLGSPKPFKGDGPPPGCPIALIQFYMASIVMALAHIHAKSIVFRNLSAENVMLDRNGYVRLVGFSLAKRLPCLDEEVHLERRGQRAGKGDSSARRELSLNTSGDGVNESIARQPTGNTDSRGSCDRDRSLGGGSYANTLRRVLGGAATVAEEPTYQFRTYTLCGKADYIGPEMIAHRGHDSRIDLWALGVLLFEMMCGETPFYRLPVSKERPDAAQTLNQSLNHQDEKPTGGPNSLANSSFGASSYYDDEPYISASDIFTNVMDFKVCANIMSISGVRMILIIHNSFILLCFCQ